MYLSDVQISECISELLSFVIFLSADGSHCHFFCTRLKLSFPFFYDFVQRKEQLLFSLETAGPRHTSLMGFDGPELCKAKRKQ